MMSSCRRPLAGLMQYPTSLVRLFELLFPCVHLASPLASPYKPSVWFPSFECLDRVPRISSWSYRPFWHAYRVVALCNQCVKSSAMAHADSTEVSFFPIYVLSCTHLPQQAQAAPRTDIARARTFTNSLKIHSLYARTASIPAAPMW